MTQIQELMRDAHATAVKAGWWRDGERNMGEMIALMHSELSEVLEDWREEKEDFYYEGEKPCGMAVEFADLLIRVFDTCYTEEIDIERALYEKMAYNKTRRYRHGDKRA